MVAQITEVELHAVISRQFRAGKLTQIEFDTVNAVIESQFNYQDRRLMLTPQIVARSKMLLAKHPLRTLDALQLASALQIQTALSQLSVGQFVFVVCDLRLLTAAQSEGLTVLNPEMP